jgi:hypothetical protein
LLKTDVESKSFFQNMPPSIMDKAYEHATTRLKIGKSPFADESEVAEPPAK